MNKTEAISLLGGSVSKVAQAIGVSPQAISQWPEKLPESLADRVLAAWARKNVKNLPAPMRKSRPELTKEAADV